ncbi:MAG TPA: hypothetical protein VGB63_07600 [Pedobacter sp.]|jgi:hypothetical protein
MKRTFTTAFSILIAFCGYSQTYLPLTGGSLTGSTDVTWGMATDNGFTVRHSNLTQGISMGYNTIKGSGTGSHNLHLAGSGTGMVNVTSNFQVNGTTNLTSPLTGTSATFTGNMGIGTTSPDALLTVGASSSSSNVVNKRLQLNSNWVATNGTRQMTALSFVATSGHNQDPFLDTGGETYKNWHLASVSEVGYYGVPRFSFIHRGSEYLTVKDDGNVGIGTTTPDSKLTVAGKIHSQEVKVTVNAGADFVFQHDYNLKPLAEVAEYISVNKHLPEIASANEMKKDGLELGEMNIKLLQKIEELTLYMIEKDKQVKALEARLNLLENK